MAEGSLATDAGWVGIGMLLAALRAVLVLGATLLLARLAARGAEGLLARAPDAQTRMLARRGAYWLVLVLGIATALHQVGFNLGVLLGAAGILSVAIGFASQTSASNLISGLFLLGERPFSIGDVIQVGDTTGEVVSIDLLSVKLRTFDNLFVRLPNESLIKERLRNLSRYPIRRADLVVGVAYDEDLDHVEEVLREVARDNPLALAEPAPVFIVTGFGDSAVTLQFSVWAARQQFLDMRNSMYREIKRAFDREGITIPFPQRVLHQAPAAPAVRAERGAGSDA